MINETITKELQKKITILEKELGIQIKLVPKINDFYSIIFYPDERVPNEKVIIVYCPNDDSEDKFDVTFMFNKETTIMVTDPRKNLELADKIIEKIKEGIN